MSSRPGLPRLSIVKLDGRTSMGVGLRDFGPRNSPRAVSAKLEVRPGTVAPGLRRPERGEVREWPCATSRRSENVKLCCKAAPRPEPPEPRRPRGFNAKVAVDPSSNHVAKRESSLGISCADLSFHNRTGPRDALRVGPRPDRRRDRDAKRHPRGPTANHRESAKTN